MVQFSVADYNVAENSATVTFGSSPKKGNVLKFFYLNTLENITPLYPPKEITVE
ncbi:MAG: hypothetical protein IKJ68_12625 [Clostridia bacterium]|nr:hypothetical protein [Clostridia bacterium]